MPGCDPEDFLASLILERGLSENTAAAYGRDLRAFIRFLGEGRSAGSIVREDIVAFLDRSRGEGLRGSTRARRAVAIRMWMRYLRERRLIASDPSELLEPPRKGLVLPRVLGEEEVFALLDGIDGDDPRSLRDRALLEVLYGCGLRVSEACAFRQEDIVGDGELVRILGKGSKERVVPLGRSAGAALERYFAGGRAFFSRGDLSETRVFLTRLGGPFTRQGIFKIIRERAAAAGIAPELISPHVLRHCYASHMLQHGADIRAIQELLGHSDISTTQIYTHVDSAKFTELHRKFHPRG